MAHTVDSPCASITARDGQTDHAKGRQEQGWQDQLARIFRTQGESASSSQRTVMVHRDVLWSILFMSVHANKPRRDLSNSIRE